MSSLSAIARRSSRGTSSVAGSADALTLWAKRVRLAAERRASARARPRADAASERVFAFAEAMVAISTRGSV